MRTLRAVSRCISTTSRLKSPTWRDRHSADLSALAERYAEIVSRREDIAHSHPATQQVGETGESLQRLRRHKPHAQSASSRVYWITTEWLERFATDALTLNRNISSALRRL